MKHSLTWADHARFRLASSSNRRQAWKNTAIIAGLLIAYGIVGTIDYAVEQAEENTALRSDIHALTRTLADCMNGRARFTHPGPHTDGYGVTAVVCQPAKEFKL